MFKKKFFLILIILLTTAGCAPYLEQSRPAIRAYYEGNFKRAAKLAGGIHPRKADKLLAYLDKATIYHAAQKYKKSIKFFAKAGDLAEVRAKQAFLPQMGAIVANDNLLPYVTSPYERLLIHTYQILNYGQLGDLEDALVEVRRINTIFPDIYTSREHRGYMKNVFSLYLSALVWELNRLCNDAYIDYKRLQTFGRKPSGLESDIARSAICAGLAERSEASKGPPPNLLIVLELGRSPVKVSTEYDHPIQVFPVPQYESQYTRVKRALVKIDGKKAGYTETLEDVGDSLEQVLTEEMPAIVARAVARLALKGAAAVAVGKEVDKQLGIMIGVMAMATNRADLRSWQTLPEWLGIWRGHLPAGKHTISLEFLDGSGRKIDATTRTLDIEEGEGKLLVFRNVK